MTQLALCEMTSPEYRIFIEELTLDYARDLAITDDLPLELTTVRAAEKIGGLLCNGQHTAEHFFRKATCTSSGKLIGNFWLNIKAKDAEAYLYYFIVVPDERRKGNGQALIALIEAFAKEHGCRQIWLNVMSHNPGALALYEKSGFRIATMHMSKNI